MSLKIAHAAVLLAAFASTACQARSDAADGGSTGAPATPAARRPAVPQEAAPPSPEQALRDIYAIAPSVKPAPGNPVSFVMPGDKPATWWFGHRFQFAGAHYFIGVAYLDGGEREGNPWGLANVSQVTYRQGPDGWTRIDSDRFIGETAVSPLSRTVSEPDRSREVLRHETRDGRLLLAIPTRRFAQDSEIFEYELFLFDPKRVEPLRHGIWAYAGTLFAGSDNSANCRGPRKDNACFASRGKVHFLPGTQELPEISVAFTGSGPGGRTYGPGDSAGYSFFPDERTYDLETSTLDP